MIPFAQAGALAALLAGAVCAQTGPPAMQFEVADIQPSKPGTQPSFSIQPGGRIDAHAITLQNFITFAWNVEENMVVGAPAWLDSDRFDLIAETCCAPPPPRERRAVRLPAEFPQPPWATA